MARITVATDDGEVLLTLTDADHDIGDLSRQFPARALVADVLQAVTAARFRDGRQKDTGAKGTEG